MKEKSLEEKDICTKKAIVTPIEVSKREGSQGKRGSSDWERTFTAHVHLYPQVQDPTQELNAPKGS